MDHILHDEAIKIINGRRLIYIDVLEGGNPLHVETCKKVNKKLDILLSYVNQQKQKDELSKVKDEIISLYRDYVFSDKLSERIVIREKITTLEVKHNLRKLECE